MRAEAQYSLKTPFSHVPYFRCSRKVNLPSRHQQCCLGRQLFALIQEIRLDLRYTNHTFCHRRGRDLIEIALILAGRVVFNTLAVKPVFYSVDQSLGQALLYTPEIFFSGVESLTQVRTLEPCCFNLLSIVCIAIQLHSVTWRAGMIKTISVICDPRYQIYSSIRNTG